MQPSTRKILVVACFVLVVSWTLLRAWRWFAPPASSSLQTIKKPEPVTKAVDDARYLSVVALGDADINAMRTLVERSGNDGVPWPKALAEAAVARLNVMRATDWDTYVAYVQRVSVSGPNADLSLRDRAKWDMDAAAWAQADIHPAAAKVRIVRAKGAEVYTPQGVSHTTNKDNGLYSKVSTTEGNTTIVRIELPARVLDLFDLKSMITSSLTMDFALVDQGKWVPVQTGVYLPNGHTSPGMPPWM
jgi:hypothetical protein